MSRDTVTNAAGTVESTFLHQVFIQSLLSRRIVSEAIALELYKRAVAAVRGMSFVCQNRQCLIKSCSLRQTIQSSIRYKRSWSGKFRDRRVDFAAKC